MHEYEPKPLKINFGKFHSKLDFPMHVAFIMAIYSTIDETITILLL